MKVLFVTHDGTSHEPLGLEYISGSLLRAGHQTKACMQSNAIQKVSTWKPDFVAFQVITGDQDRWGGVAREIKSNFPHIKTIFGGPHFLFFSNAKQPEADIVIRGDAEVNILHAVEGRPWDDFKMILDLDSRAHPDRGLFYNDDFPGVKNNVIRNFISCQGCPYKCFVAGTLVLMYNGEQKRIEDIRVGDSLIAIDVETGEQKKERVTFNGSRTAEDTYEVELEDGTIFQATSEHPFWTKNGWKELSGLSISEELLKVSDVQRADKIKKKKNLLGGLRFKENIRIEDRCSESDEEVGNSFEGFSHDARNTRGQALSSLEGLSPRRSDDLSGRINRGKKKIFRANESSESDVRSGLQSSRECKSKTSAPRGTNFTSISGLLERARNSFKRFIQASLGRSGAYGSSEILDRPVCFRNEEESGFHSSVEENGGPFQRSLLAHSSGYRTSDAGLLERGMVVSESMGGVLIAEEQKNSHPDYAAIPGTWTRIKRISLLGTRQVYSISVSNQENFIANGYLVHNCTYCFNSNENWQKMIQEKRLRYHSPEWLIEDIERTFKDYGGKLVSFQDDIFGIDLDWLERFSRLYQKVRIPFFAQLRPRLITEDRVRLLKEAGIHIVSFAVESGNAKTRREFLDREEPNEIIERGCQLLHDHGIKFRMQNMLGIPVEDPLGDALETLRFNMKCRPTLSWCSLLQAYPGTAIAKKVVKMGMVKSEDDLLPLVNATFFDESSLPIKGKKQIERLHKYWSAVVRWPWLYPIVRVLINFDFGRKFHNWVFEKSKGYINAREYWRVERMDKHVSITSRLAKELQEEKVCA